MKHLKLLLLFLLVIPFIVLAEDCDITSITITSMEQASIEGNTEVLSEPTYQDRNIKLDLKMYEVGDSITYNLVIKNDGNEDYMIDEDTFKTDSEYIEYSLSIEDSSNVVKAKSTKNLALKISYKREVEDNLLTNRMYDASNILMLSMNTSEKVKELKIITTDNIKKLEEPTKISDTLNPLTSSTGIKLISIVLLTTIAIIFLTIINKRKYNKYLIIILSISLLPIVYAVCKCDVTVETKIEIEKLSKLYDTVVGLSELDNACVTKYEGQVTDEVNKTVPATNVYYDRCEDRNLIFGGYCWQVIRTSETEGTKVIYNGEPVDGKCESTRENQTGIGSDIPTVYNMNSEYLYGSSFTYDEETEKFTLTDTTTATWSDSTYEDLLGMYTCRSMEDTCSNIIHISSYSSSTSASIVPLKIESTDYQQIGIIPYEEHEYSLAKVGYMHNKEYENVSKYMFQLGSFILGSSFRYDSSTNMYTLSGTQEEVTNWDSMHRYLEDTRYTCWNTTGTCETLAFIYDGTGSYAYYIELKNGKDKQDYINEMLYAEDVNKHNSTIKGIVDGWYRHNMVDYTDKLEDVVYCNSRNIVNYGSWNPNVALHSSNSSLQFKNSVRNEYDLSCSNITDQFAVSNDKAKLTYPVALIQGVEANKVYTNTTGIINANRYWWTMSPNSLIHECSEVSIYYKDGYIGGFSLHNGSGVRPVISLKNENVIFSGTGSEVDPWIIK